MVTETIESVAAKSTAARRSATVLLVDDDSNFRNGMRRIFWLLRKGVNLLLLEAGQGSEALTVLESYKVDCILLDYRLPGGNGLEWIERFHAGHANIPVIMITGEGDEETAVLALRKGAVDYLVKGGLTPESLHRSILNALEKEEMRVALERQRGELLDAERQRVMIESLGTACHHIGQPMTVISLYLQMMQDNETTPEKQAMIQECLNAASRVGAILERLQRVSEYRRVPYLVSGKAPGSEPGDAILDV